MDEVMKRQSDDCVAEDADFYDDISLQFSSLPDVAKPLMRRAKDTLSKIGEMLCAAPSFIHMVKANVPKEMLTAVLTDGQKEKIANGALKLMTKKDGSILATLVDAGTNHAVAHIPMKSVKVAPEVGQAISNYSSQVQMAQIAEKIELVQKAVEDVRRGQEDDRLATAFSCRQKFLQVMKFQNPGLRSAALLRIAMDAEDSRNLLMQSQKGKVDFIKEQPESFWKKFFSGANPKEISLRMSEIRDSLYAVNVVSLVEAMAYQEIGETEAAQQSLKYYGEHLHATFLNKDGFVERLDQIDDSPENYWSKTLPDIERKIMALPSVDAERIGLSGE